ncbi:glycosyltransferase [bacterium]|nr:glycosyltransferase [bacterium]
MIDSTQDIANQYFPVVSVFMAVRNEEKVIKDCLDSFLNQSYPKDKIEVVLAVSGNDGTRSTLESYQSSQPTWLRMYENPHGGIAQGLNIALKKCKGDIVALYIGHAIPSKTYIENVVRILLSGEWDMVCGRVVPWTPSRDLIPNTIIQAFSSRFAVGTNSFTRRKFKADTIGHWHSVKREYVDKAGFFNESLVRGEDCDWYKRLIDTGARSCFSPTIVSRYRTIESFPLLFSKGFQNARHRMIASIRHNACLNKRHTIPLFSGLGIVVYSIFRKSFSIFAKAACIYTLISFLAAYAATIQKRSFAFTSLTALSIITYHTAHFLGSLAGIVNGLLIRFGSKQEDSE